MKVWIVTTNDYPEPFGSEIYCHGVYTSRSKAKEVLHKMRQGIPDNLLKEYERAHIHLIELDKDSNIYLGGYV